MRRSLLALPLLLAGCATHVQVPPPQACTPPAQPSLVAELLFGLSIPGGGAITQAQFDSFVQSDLTPRFPAGLTIVPADGRYRPPDGGSIAESSRMVMIVAPDDAATAAKLHAARLAYKAQFQQHSVGLITIQSCASF